MARIDEEVINSVTTFVELNGIDISYNKTKRSYNFKLRQRFILPGRDVYRGCDGVGITINDNQLLDEIPAYNPNTGEAIPNKTYSWRDLDRALYSALIYAKANPPVED